MAETKTLTGGCQCGRVRYTINASPAMAAHCHCTDCQKSTGTGHVTAALFPSDAVKITGELKEYGSMGDSGQPVSRFFCPNCGSRIMSKATVMPGMAIITLGSLDDPDAIGPVGMALYGKRRRAWDKLDPSIQTFDMMPPPPAG